MQHHRSVQGLLGSSEVRLDTGVLGFLGWKGGSSDRVSSGLFCLHGRICMCICMYIHPIMIRGPATPITHLPTTLMCYKWKTEATEQERIWLRIQREGKEEESRGGWGKGGFRTSEKRQK